MMIRYLLVLLLLKSVIAFGRSNILCGDGSIELGEVRLTAVSPSWEEAVLRRTDLITGGDESQFPGTLIDPNTMEFSYRSSLRFVSEPAVIKITAHFSRSENLIKFTAQVTGASGRVARNFQLGPNEAGQFAHIRIASGFSVQDEFYPLQFRVLQVSWGKGKVERPDLKGLSRFLERLDPPASLLSKVEALRDKDQEADTCVICFDKIQDPVAIKVDESVSDDKAAWTITCEACLERWYQGSEERKNPLSNEKVTAFYPVPTK